MKLVEKLGKIRILRLRLRECILPFFDVDDFIDMVW